MRKQNTFFVTCANSAALYSRVLPLVAAAAVAGYGGSARADLAGYWSFDEANDQTVFDQSASANHGVLGPTSGVEASDPARVSGHVGAGALSFTRSEQDRVTVPDSGSLDIGGAGGSDQMTIAAWVNIPNYANYHGIVGKGPSSGSNANYPGNYELRVDQGTGNLLFLFESPASWANTHTQLASTSPVPAGSYQHVAVTVSEADPSDTTVTLYINGTEAGTQTFTLPSENFGETNDQPLLIGSRNDLFTSLNGSLDEVAIWSDVLPAESIAGLASGAYTPLTAPVPEPTAIGFVVAGAGFLLGRRRRT